MLKGQPHQHLANVRTDSVILAAGSIAATVEARAPIPVLAANTF
jgi:hypothetical protein